MLVDGHGDRIDEVGHVIGNDVNYGVWRMPSMTVEIRGVDEDFSLLGGAGCSDAVVLQGCPVEFFRAGFVKAGNVSLGEIVLKMVGDERRDSLPCGNFAQIALQAVVGI